MPVPNYWTWSKIAPQKSDFSGQILMKLRLWNFFHRNTQSYQTLVTWPHLQYNLSHVIKLCWRHHEHKLWRHNFFFKIPLFKKAKSNHFCWHHQNFNKPCLLKKYWKTKKKLKELEVIYPNAIYLCISWYNKIFWFPVKKCWCRQNSRAVSRDSHIFLIFFR